VLVGWTTVAPRRAAAQQTQTLREISRVAAFEIVTELSAGSVAVAEPLELRVTVRGPEESRLEFPPQSDRLGELEIIDQTGQENLPTRAGRRVSRWSWRLEGLLPGQYRLPAIAPRVSVAGEPLDLPELRSHPFTVEVTSTLSEPLDPAQFRDIQPAVELPGEEATEGGRWRRLKGLALAGGAVALGVAAASGFWLHRRRRALTPRQWAERELDQLAREAERGDLTARRRVERLDRTLRAFLAMQLGQPAAAMSAAELVEVLRADARVDGEVRGQLEKLLDDWERVKFAGEVPEPGDIAPQLAETRKLIQRVEASVSTAPRPSSTSRGAV
jgi:hypothetical protein